MPFDQLLTSPSTLTLSSGETVQLVKSSDLTPVASVVVETASGGVVVDLPDSFAAEIDDADEYAVTHSKQTYLKGGGEIKITNKTASGFTVEHTGSVHGEKVHVTIWRV